MLRHDDAVVLRDDLMMTDQELWPGVTSIDIPVETKRLISSRDLQHCRSFYRTTFSVAQLIVK